MNQLGLPISLDSKMLLNNFVGNKELLDCIHQFYVNKSPVEIYVYGAQGFGKTHVLQGAVLKALSDNQNAIYIDCNDSLPEHILDSIDQLNLISLDNVDVIKNDNQDFFFDLYNRARQAKVSILVSGSNMPTDLSVMKDLKTRLSLAAVYKLEELKDELTMSVLNNQMSERNLTIDSKVYEYLFKYYSRDVKILLSAMGQLDRASLQSKKAISIPFVKKMLRL